MKKSFFVFTFPFLIAAFLAAIYLFTGCQKNVGVIINILKYDITGYVYESGSVAISGAEVFVDGKLVTTTDATGKYVIPKVVTGTYLVEASKTGYIKNKFNVTVSEAGALTSALTLKKVTPPVTVTTAGGTVTGTSSPGVPAATLTIPAGALTATAQISVTPLSGNEAPDIPPSSSGTVLGVTVSLDSSDPNITFPNGITLTFNLPFPHQPGTFLEVVTFNEKTKLWETYKNALVSSDGKTASLKIYHFSTWNLMVKASFTQTVVTTNAPAIVPYANLISWTITPAYTITPSGVALDAALSQWLGNIFAEETWLIFIGTNQISFDDQSKDSNPAGYGTLAPITWKLLKYSYQVRGSLQFSAYYGASMGNYTAVCLYEMPYYVWLWRDSETLAFPAQTCPAKLQSTIPKIVLSSGHHGGGGS